MDLGLEGKTALITGASQGIGKAIAKTLAAEGCNIIICSRDFGKLETTAREIKKLGVRVFYSNFDATDLDSVENFFLEISESWVNGIDILVNNVGGGTEKSKRFLDISKKEEWFRLYELNVLTMVWFVQKTIHLLTKSGHGKIINISTLSARQPGRFNPHYGAAKASMLFLSKYLANELAPNGVCVNAICPHSLIGESWERDILDRSETQKISVEEARRVMTKEVLVKIPMGRQGTHQDIANLAVFLASPKSNFITGTCIAVDGGTVKSIF